jgi:uncharacterized protein
MAWDIVIMILLSVLALAGWVLALVGISGTWLILIAAVALDLAVDGGWGFVATSIVFLLLCAAAEGAEFVAGSLGAKVFGGSKAAQVGAFAGTLLGGIGGTAIPIPIVGTIIGVLAGGFVGALAGELYQQQRTSAGAPRPEGTGKDVGVKAGMRAGLGAAIARVAVIAMKVSLATLMLAWFVWVLVAHLAD